MNLHYVQLIEDDYKLQISCYCICTKFNLQKLPILLTLLYISFLKIVWIAVCNHSFRKGEPG